MNRFIFAALLTVGLECAYADVNFPPIKVGTTSVVLDCVPLYGTDDDGATAQAGLDENTTGLEVQIKTDLATAWTSYTQAGGTIEDITTSGTLGTYETPTASHVRFEDTGEGCYQLQFPDSVFATSGAAKITIKIHDSGAAIIDQFVHIDQAVADLDDIGGEVDDSLTSYDPSTGTEVAALNDLSIADIRTAIGMAAANLDTQLAALPTASENATATVGEQVEVGVDVQCALAVILAFAAGDYSRSDTTTTFYAPDDSTQRIIATADNTTRSGSTLSCP